MTDTTSLLANVDHLIIMEIAKDKTRADMPIVRSYVVKHADEIADFPAYIDSLILKDAAPPESIGDPGPGAPPSKPASNLSVKVENGNNLYLIRLTNGSDYEHIDTRAKWGAGSPPISFLPENVYGNAKPIKHVGLYYADGRHVRFIPEGAIPARLDDVPDNTWLAFRCDIADMRKLWAALGYDATKPFLIPFRYNLFDRRQKTPIWNVDHSHLTGFDDHDDHDAKATATKYIETHGGKHPNDLISLYGLGPLAIYRGRVHGGIHPNSLVEFFYGDP
jgi:hypothetical protein